MHRTPESCHVVEVSRKGVLVRCSRNLRPGTVIQCAFAYDRESNETRLFRRWTRVARRAESGFALVFIDLKRDTKGFPRNISC